MATPNAGHPVQAEKSEPVSTPAAAPAAPASSFTDRVLKANSPAEIRALKEEALRPAPVQPAPAAAPAAAAPAAAPEPAPTEEPAPTDTPAGEETPAETPAEGDQAPAAAAEGDDEGEEGGDGGEGPVTPHSGKRAHLRLADNDEVGRLAASFKKRNRDWTLEECLNAAKQQLGVKPETTAAPAPEAPKSDLPATLEEVDAAEESLLAQKAKELTALNFEEAHKIDVALRKLDRHRGVLEKQAEQRQSQEVTNYQQSFAASQARAEELYPFAADPESPQGKRMAEIDASMKETKDPLYSSPDKPLKIAQMVAAEFSIAPKRKGAPAAPVKPAAPVTPAPKKGVVPSGSSRTTPATTVAPAIDAEIHALKTPLQIREFRKKHGLPI